MVAVGLAVCLCVGLFMVVSGVTGAVRGRHVAGGLIGYPSYLPRGTLDYQTDHAIVGTASRPALTSQGDAVRVVTPRWSALAVVSGPLVPGEGLPYQTPATTCTWTVTLSDATAPVPISATDFNAVNAEGFVYRPSLVPGRRPPSVLEPGRTVTFQLRAVAAVGEGLMRWAPFGRRIVAKWDYVVEND